MTGCFLQNSENKKVFWIKPLFEEKLHFASKPKIIAAALIKGLCYRCIKNNYQLQKLAAAANLFNAVAWEYFLDLRLPQLNYFYLKNPLSSIFETGYCNLLGRFLLNFLVNFLKLFRNSDSELNLLTNFDSLTESKLASFTYSPCYY